MEHIGRPPVFPEEDILRLQAYKGKMFVDVVYHTWVNRSRPAEEVRVLDVLELQFADAPILYLQQPEDVPGGLRIVTYDPVAEAKRISTLFGDHISLESHHEIRNALWSGWIGGTLDEWLTYRDADGNILADELIMRCGKDYVQIRAADDGLEVFPWEPDES